MASYLGNENYKSCLVEPHQNRIGVEHRLGIGHCLCLEGLLLAEIEPDQPEPEALNPPEESPSIPPQSPSVEVSEQEGAYLVNQNPAEALPYFEQVLNIEPDGLILLSFRVAALLKLHQYQDALYYIDHILTHTLVKGVYLGLICLGKGNALQGLNVMRKGTPGMQKLLNSRVITVPLVYAGM